jgi:hypothetical protein
MITRLFPRGVDPALWRRVAAVAAVVDVLLLLLVLFFGRA